MHNHLGKEIDEVKIIFASNSQWFYGNSHNAIYINNDGYACELCSML